MSRHEGSILLGTTTPYMLPVSLVHTYNYSMYARRRSSTGRKHPERNCSDGLVFATEQCAAHISGRLDPGQSKTLDPKVGDSHIHASQ